MGDIGKRLKGLREARGMSIATLARKLGVAASTLREWEQGRQIRGEPYARMANALGVTLGELLLGSSDNSSIAKDLDEIEQVVERIRQKL